MNTIDKKLLFSISTLLGFKGAKSYSILYEGGTINTFGDVNNSGYYFTIHLNKENEIIGIETNTTYFKPTKQILKINSLVSFENPMSLNDALMYLTKI